MHFSTILLFVIFPVLIDAEVISLSGTNWNVKGNDGGNYGEIQAPASVPGGIYTDLSGIEEYMPENYLFGFNDINYRWISNINWTYSTSFDVPENLFVLDNINLIFHGVDTISSIWLNGKQIGETNNMFIRYNFNVKNTLKVSDNQLEVRILAAPEQAAKRFKASSHPIPPSSAPTSYHGEPYAQMIRKMQCSFSWDWGPAFPSAGIWKDIELVGYDPLAIRDIQWSSPSASSFEYIIYLETDAQASLPEDLGKLEIILIDPVDSSVVYQETLPVSGSNFSNGVIKISKSVDNLAGIKLWWPNGLGNQSLYQFTVIYGSSSGRTVSKSINVGFRAIELVQDPVENSDGASFYFKVNGQAFFVKGANWIPADVLPEKQQDEKYLRWLLKSAQIANMNMLRVWGGGVYESELFYQLADELGILIWQDLMYAVALYPATPEFLESAAEEARQQIRRLHHHPSVAIWAGNNELETAIVSHWYPEQSQYDEVLRSDYRALFVNTLLKVAEEEDSSRPYVISSPSNGVDTVQEGGIANNPSDPKWGDVHFYQYGADGWLVSTYPTPRFASEYGYQSLPELSSWRDVAEAVDLALGSDLLRHREHAPQGYAPLRLQTGYQLPLPEGNHILLAENFEPFIYASQIYQAVSYKVETEHFRCHQSDINEIGEGRTMGSLYWQLNDVWIAPTWAGIDKFGRWKMVHYYAVNFYAPLLATAEIDSSNTIRIYLISDYIEELDVKLKLNFFNWNASTPISTKSSAHTLNLTSSLQVLETRVDDLISQNGCANKVDCYLQLQLSSASYSSPDNYVYFAPLKDSFSQMLTPQSLTATILSGPSKSFLDETPYAYTIQVSTDVPTFFTWLSFNNRNITGRFSENGFHLLESKKLVTFYSDSESDSATLQELLYVYSLRDKLVYNNQL